MVPHFIIRTRSNTPRLALTHGFKTTGTATQMGSQNGHPEWAAPSVRTSGWEISDEGDLGRNRRTAELTSAWWDPR